MLLPSPLQHIHDDRLSGVELWLKRDDLIHPGVGGNKYRKLMPNLALAREQGCDSLLTFGGSYSNHIAATASLGRMHGFRTFGLIRGEQKNVLTGTLTMAQLEGMNLRFIGYEAYRRRHDAAFLQELSLQYGERTYLLPEGGTNDCSLQGCWEIVREVSQQLADRIDYWCVPVGTGGTMQGMLQARESASTQFIGFAALPITWMNPNFVDIISESPNAQLLDQFMLDGFGRISPELIAFVRDFYQRHCILLDLNYTGKMLYGIFEMVKQNFFPMGSRIVAVHTGGQQGLLGFAETQGVHLGSQHLCY